MKQFITFPWKSLKTGVASATPATPVTTALDSKQERSKYALYVFRNISTFIFQIKKVLKSTPLKNFVNDTTYFPFLDIQQSVPDKMLVENDNRNTLMI